MADLVHVGVTGTRHPLTEPQDQALFRQLLIIDQAHDERIMLHHGCCKEADEKAHRFARQLGWRIEGHPGHDANGESPWRCLWVMDDLDVIHKELPYGSRNDDIVIVSGVLVAIPAYPESHWKSQRSGTWMTIRMARDRGRPVTLVWPDGSTEADHG